MKIEDFRIGNNIQNGIIHMVGYFNGKLGIYCLKNKFMSFSDFHEFENIKPIEITKQLFYELGFKSDNDEATILIKNGFEIIELNDNSFEFLNHDYPIKIKYVHQLQNLYYALQGEELSLSGI